MELKIRNMSWFKRREPTEQIKPISVTVDELVLEQNCYCEMKVTYSDGSEHTFDGRVSQNDITGKWTIHGMNPHGLSTLVDVIE